MKKADADSTQTSSPSANVPKPSGQVLPVRHHLTRAKPFLVHALPLRVRKPARSEQN